MVSIVLETRQANCDGDTLGSRHICNVTTHGKTGTAQIGYSPTWQWEVRRNKVRFKRYGFPAGHDEVYCDATAEDFEGFALKIGEVREIKCGDRRLGEHDIRLFVRVVPNEERAMELFRSSRPILAQA